VVRADPSRCPSQARCARSSRAPDSPPRSSATPRPHFVYPDEPTALRALLSSGPCVRAIDVAGEDAVRRAIAGSISAYRRPDGSHQLDNVWRFAICRRDDAR